MATELLVVILVIKQIGLPLHDRPMLLITQTYDYRPNCTPLSPLAIDKISLISFHGLPWQNKIKKNATGEPLHYGHLGDRKKVAFVL